MHRAVEQAQFFGSEVRTQATRVDFRAPEALVGIDVAHAAKNGLIEQQGLNVRFARVDCSDELRFGGFERIEAERAENGRLLRFRDDGDASEAANVGVTQLAAIIEGEKDVRVRASGSFRRIDHELTCHAEVNEESELSGAVAGVSEFKDEEFSVAADLVDACAGDVTFERGGIVDEIGFAEAHADYATPRQDGLQAADDGFDFGKLWHNETLHPKFELENRNWQS